MLESIADKVLKHCSSLSIIIKGDSSHISVAIFPQNRVAGGKMLKPITISGLPKDVDAELEDAIEKIFVQNSEVFSNVDTVAEAPVKEAPAKTSSTSRSTAKAEAPKAEVKPVKVEVTKLKADEKKAWEKITDALGKAAKAKDVDVINYLEKQMQPELAKVKSQLEAATKEFTEGFDNAKKALTDKKEKTNAAKSENDLFDNQADQSEENTSSEDDQSEDEEQSDDSDIEDRTAEQVDEEVAIPLSTPSTPPPDKVPAAAPTIDPNEIF